MDPDLFEALLTAAGLVLAGFLTWLIRIGAARLKKEGVIRDEAAFVARAETLARQAVRWVEAYARRKKKEGLELPPAAKLELAVKQVQERVPKLSTPDAELVIEAALADYRSIQPPPYASLPPLSFPPAPPVPKEEL